MLLNRRRFLVEGARGAVLHTGDLRAELWFIESLRHNPYVQRYVATRHTTSHSPKLEVIYLDTACLLNTYEVPSKVGHQHDKYYCNN